MKPSSFVDQLLNIHGDPNRFRHATCLRARLGRLGDLFGCLQLEMDLREARLDGRFDDFRFHDLSDSTDRFE